MSARAVVLAAMLGSAGCALVTKSPPVRVRYVTPEVAAATTSPAPAAALQLRLGRVDAASHIRDRIAFRDATPEVGYYGTLRWTEPPEAYLRRAMARALFEQRQVQEIVSGPGPALELELHAFEEVRAPRHAARVVVTWRLRGDRTVRMQRTLTVEQPIAAAAHGEAAHAIAAAIGVALRDVVDAVVGDVIGELRRISATSP